MEQLIYGGEYFCFLEDEYPGTATFINDPHIGDSFRCWWYTSAADLKKYLSCLIIGF